MVSLAEDITEKTNSKNFVNCIEEIAKKFPDECEKYNILDNIKTCKIMLDIDKRSPNNSFKSDTAVKLPYGLSLC